MGRGTAIDATIAAGDSRSVDDAIGMADLDAVLNEVAGHLNAQHARLVDVAVQLQARPSEWRGPGVHTVEQYLAWRVGIAPARAKQIVEIASRVEELPTCVETFRRGELAVDQMAAIAHRAPWWTDAEACELGRNATVSQLRAALGRYEFPAIPRPDEDRAESNDESSDGRQRADVGDVVDSLDAASVMPADRCAFHVGDDDRFRLSVETDAATGAIIESALRESRDRLFHDGNGDVTWTDALREVAERSLDTVTDTARRDRFRVHLHLDTTGDATDATGWRLPDAIRRHLTCDGLLTPVFVDNGIPLSVGRTQRIVPERTRRVVEHRDRGCRVHGCTHTGFVEIHHIVHWEDGGSTDTWNLVALCPHHHRLHHRGELGISGNADEVDGLVFTNRHGNPIAQSGARPQPPGAPPPPPDGTYRHPLGERLHLHWVHFNPPREHRNAN